MHAEFDAFSCIFWHCTSFTRCSAANVATRLDVARVFLGSGALAQARPLKFVHSVQCIFQVVDISCL